MPPEGPETELPKPKYLELIYHPDDDAESVTTQPSQRSSVHLNSNNNNINNNNIINNSSDYEIPITDLILKAASKLSEKNFNRSIECTVGGEVKTML